MQTAGEQDSWDSTYPAYYQLADLISSIASAHSGVAIDSGTEQRWREVMGVMREVDTHIDDTDVSRDEVLDELRSFDRFRGRYPHITPEALGPVMHNRLLERTKMIFALGQSVTHAATIEDHLAARATEAIHTSELFADTASAEVLEQPNFRSSFMPLLRSLGIAACMLDSAHDADMDYRTGKRMLPPSRRFSAQALKLSVAYTLPCLPILKHRPVVKELMRAARIRSRRKKYAEERFNTDSIHSGDYPA